MIVPKRLSIEGNCVKLEVPPGWLSNITVISRQTYKQTATINRSQGGASISYHLASQSGETRETMTDAQGQAALAIVPDDSVMMLDLNFHYAEGADSLPSHSCTMLNFSKSDERDGTHYCTFLIFVRDKDVDTTNARLAKTDDAVATIHCLGGFKPRPVQDQASSGIWTTIFSRMRRPGLDIDELDPIRAYETSDDIAKLPVCIIGAGAAGLYTAMMLDSLGINYRIIEASGRVGGRLYTHKFYGTSASEYFDVGAMRYPRIPIMQRVFDLLQDRLGLTEKLLPVVMSHPRNIMHFNGVRLRKEQIVDPSDTSDNAGVADQFHVLASQNVVDGFIPEEYLRKGYKQLYKEAINDLRQLFVTEPKFSKALEKLMIYDEHTVRSYMSQVKSYPGPVINWIETMEWRTAMFDSSLTEVVLASLAFDDPSSENQGKSVEWSRINGGSQVLADAMHDKVKIKPKFHRRVIAIKEVKKGDVHPLMLTFDARDDPNLLKNGLIDRTYSNVICTIPLSCLRLVDLDECRLMAGQRNALRELQYSPSIKIGIQFKSAWWEDDPIGIVGGQSYTDRPVRTVVYPSNQPDSRDHPNVNVLIACYNGMQDSQRLGALMRGRDTPEERILLNLVMKDLAAIHSVDVDKLWKEYVDYYPWDWYSSSLSLGAFAWFGPGQFKHVLRSMIMPASREQRLFFAGDALSSRHGWVAGALESAWRCVFSLLYAHEELYPKDENGRKKNLLAEFLDLWQPSMEWDDQEALQQIIAEGRRRIQSQT